MKSFKAINDLELNIIKKKTCIIFEIGNEEDKKTFDYSFEFTSETFKDIYDYLMEESKMIWDSINPKEATSLSSDYDEYYDKKLDNNGSLSIKQNTLILSKPSLESNKLYQFNKRKMESFLYDYKKMI